MEAYDQYEDELKRKRIEAAKEEIRMARRKLKKMEDKLSSVEEDEEEIEEVEKTDFVDKYLGLILLSVVGLYVLYRYLEYGFI